MSVQIHVQALTEDLTCFLTIRDKTLYPFNNSDDWEFEVVSERYVMTEQSSLSLGSQSRSLVIWWIVMQLLLKG